MTEWRDISTAPKDGTHILVGTFPHEPGRITTTTAHWFDFNGEWALSVNYDGAYSNHGVSNPTHWMPLPEDPIDEPECKRCGTTDKPLHEGYCPTCCR